MQEKDQGISNWRCSVISEHHSVKQSTSQLLHMQSFALTKQLPPPLCPTTVLKLSWEPVQCTEDPDPAYDKVFIILEKLGHSQSQSMAPSFTK